MNARRGKGRKPDSPPVPQRAEKNATGPPHGGPGAFLGGPLTYFLDVVGDHLEDALTLLRGVRKGEGRGEDGAPVPIYLDYTRDHLSSALVLLRRIIRDAPYFYVEISRGGGRARPRPRGSSRPSRETRDFMATGAFRGAARRNRGRG